MIVFLKLLLAHTLADFLLQPNHWVQEKELLKIKSGKLLLHILVHVCLTLIILYDFSMWPAVVIIGATHYMIDLGKLYSMEKLNHQMLFWTDQGLHISVLLMVAYYCM